MAQQKVSFKKWWKNITGTKAVKGLFNIDLVDSITYASIPVHYSVNGKTVCQGYIPTIVSKCGWLLKEQATKTRGIFRVSGSAKRVAELQLIFDTPPHYGSQLDWAGYTIHDASNVLRRYLNHLPDPVITLEYYEKFRDVNRNIIDDNEKITAYQELISKLPPPHSCLLMYLLDLLALFSHHSDENLMDSKNLASVFQPGVLSHPDHSMSPGEYMASAAVLKFLIDHQSSFTLPKPNIDDDDDEMVNFGIINHPPQHRLPVQGDPRFHGGGYVTASDHERIHNGVSFEADDAVHILSTGMKRQHSLHKPIISHSTLPGNTPQRSRSTNSSVSSSRRSSQSSLFSSNFITRGRSNRASKTGSKIITDAEFFPSIDNIEQIEESTKAFDNSQVGDDSTKSAARRDSSLHKAATSPLLISEGNTEFSAYLSRRNQLKNEGLRREPSIICQEIEIQFQAPFIETPLKRLSTQPGLISSQLVNQPRGNGASQNLGDSSQKEKARVSVISTSHISDLPQRQPEGIHSPPHNPSTMPSVPKRTSVVGEPQSLGGGQNTQRSTNVGMPIFRAKSNPGGLVSTGLRDQSQGGSNVSSSHAIGKFKGLFAGKNRDNDSIASQKEGDDKEEKKIKKKESMTDKQRKYKSQEVALNHNHGSFSTGWKGSPASSIISEHEGGNVERAYTRPPPPRPQQSGSIPPQRPPPPPPEESLMDLLELPQRLGHHSGYSTPSEGSRSASPARSPSSNRSPLAANTTFNSASSAISSSDRLHHGKPYPYQGSTSSLDFVINSDDSGSHSRQRPARPGHLPPTPTPKSRDRRTQREGSISSTRRGDATPPKARSVSSRNSSPVPSPSLKPLSRNVSSQSIQSRGGYSNNHQQQHHFSSPLAEGQGASFASPPPPPSARARNRAQSRDEQHFLNRQQSGSISGLTQKDSFRDRDRNQTRTGQAIRAPAHGTTVDPNTS
ncbi:hypothetical protein BGZ76_010543 [Entomortierella beljakovae]|nr:hypothetical protein BGZ76_010543 [Entomortierella beljakovae]